MVKVAFVGCGGIMAEHYKHLSSNPQVRMVGHCDTDADRARAAADRHGGQPFTDVVTMYDKAKPQAVYVGVPPFAHGDIEEAAAERCIHLFIEKPVALQRETARRVATAIRRAKIITSVGYCFRYCDTAALARRLLKGKAISLVSGYYVGGMPEVWWWRKRDKSGGQILEQTTHIFDLLRYFCGDVAEVHGVASRGCVNKVKEYDIDDSSVVSLRLKNGASASVSSTCIAANGGRSGLEIITPEGSFHFRGGTLTVKEDGVTTTYHPGVNMFEEEDRVFIDAVAGGKSSRIRSSYHDAVKTLMVSAAANESIETGLPVRP